MSLPELCIKRPAFTIVLSLVLTIIGGIGFMQLPVRWIPNVNPPEVSIFTAYPGANASLVESQVTMAIETALAGVNGIETLTSHTKQGQSYIDVTFKLGHNMDVATEDIRSSIERIRSGLPKDASSPVVAKADSNNTPILFLSFADKQRSAREVSDYVHQFIIPKLETVEGVGAVLYYGDRISAMRVWLDPAKMAGANVTTSDVNQLLQDQNTALPSGQIRTADRFYSVVTDITLKNAEQFNDLIIRDNNNQLVRLKDIGEAKIDAANSDSSFRVNSQPAVALGIIPQSTANPLDVESNVQKAFAMLTSSLPAGMQAAIVYNQADYIRASIHSVYEAFFEAVFCVWMVVLLFIGKFRPTWIPIVTIPVCIISTFAILYLFGFSINTITLMAFVLAIGLVVDDAIVMLENINRHIESGMHPMAAAIKGSREMIFPIIAMTLTLAAVYTPIAFTAGLLGILFREFTFTLAGAVLISGFVALTLSPMMCSRWLTSANLPQNNRRGGNYSIWLTAKISIIQARYRRILCYVLAKRLWVIAALVVIGIGGYLVFHTLPSELVPMEDMSEVDVYVAGPRDASFAYTDTYVRQMEDMYRKIPEVQSYFTEVGMGSPSRSYHVLMLKPRGQRQRALIDIEQELTQKVNKIPGVQASVYTPSPALADIVGDEGQTIGLVVTGSDYQRLYEGTQSFLEALRKNPLFQHVDNNLRWDGEQFTLSINREKIADLAIPIQNITDTISTLLAGRVVGHFEHGSNQYDIIVQMTPQALANPNIIQQLYVRNVSGVILPLSDVVSMRTTSSPDVLRHFSRLRSNTVYVSLAHGYKLADAVHALQMTAKRYLPDDMKYTFIGEAKNFLESNSKTTVTFLLALVFIYLVLVAQFESFIDPFIILLTVPFAVVGAMLTLKVTGGGFNIYSNIGLITLIGLITKHGILITEFANRLRVAGQSIQDAIVEAAILRLRPILMTTSAMVLGALPLAFASGPGAESRQQIGWVIVGGLLLGTFFSLVVVPIAYTYLAPFKKIRTADVVIEQE
ncbi:MAG: hypothetical protein A3E83_04355 [Gammaproteobacteria bacterium RIFCSPHIGHO2_12_FULL_41_20]|nr:MAG: hypothetical protein A3E83_04355 [Gammaproteobacteria bacterium RIFCSPHIGHO2_12_FULL_41_20]